jgi:integrase
MPRREKGARLIERKRKDRANVWVIKDTGGFERSTGTSSREEAEAALAEYIAGKFRPSGPTKADEFRISHILAIYADEHAIDAADRDRISYAIDALEDYWGELVVSDIKGETCRRYAKTRKKIVRRDPKTRRPIEWAPVSVATIRRELGTLRAALRYCAGEGYLIEVPVVKMPDKPETEERWLTRQQVAILLWAARKLNVDGRQQMIRFILTAVYTGTRRTAALALGIDIPRTDSGWVDTTRGMIYRKGTQERATAKRRRPARCPARLLMFVRLWKKNGAKFVCEDYQGNRVANLRKGWDRMADLAMDMAELRGIEMPPRKHLTPHILKHTAITWAMQNGSTMEDAASFFSTSTDTIERVYWHHSPFCQESAVEAINNPVKALKRGRFRGRG